MNTLNSVGYVGETIYRLDYIVNDMQTQQTRKLKIQKCTVYEGNCFGWGKCSLCGKEFSYE